MPSAVLSLTPSTPDLCEKGSVWREENAQACFADQQAFKWEISAFFKKIALSLSNWGAFSPLLCV